MIALALIAVATGLLGVRLQPARQAIAGVALGSMVLGAVVLFMTVGFVLSLSQLRF